MVPRRIRDITHAPINLSQAELKTWCEKYWASKVFDGFEGSIDGWCDPKTTIGSTAEITDPNYPTATGTVNTL